jgi:hypothetical protein
LRGAAGVISFGIRMNEPAKAPAPQSQSEQPAKEKPTKELTPEEQMEQFEEDLKETDWGHQPC